MNGVVESCTQIVYKRGRRVAHQPAHIERTDVTWHISSQGIEPHQENLTKKQRQLMTIVLITNVVPEKLDEHSVLFTYKGQAVVEVQFHLLKTPCLASQVFVKKPERIEALLMLLQVALLIRALLQYHARVRVKEMKEIPRIGLNRQKYDKPTAYTLLIMVRSHFIIFDGKQRRHGYCDSFQEERLITLLEMVDVDERLLFEH